MDKDNAIEYAYQFSKKAAEKIPGNYTPLEAFKETYKTKVVLEYVEEDCLEGCWGRTVNMSHYIKFYRGSRTHLSQGLVAHEFGHTFDDLIGNNFGYKNSPYQALALEWNTNSSFPRRSDYPNGFAGGFMVWEYPAIRF